MFKHLVVGIVIFGLSSQATAQAGFLRPAIGVEFSFGGSGQSNSYKAHLAFNLAALNEAALQKELPQQPQSIRYFSFSSSQAEGAMLRFMGSPVAVWSEPKNMEFSLQQNEQGSSSSSWFTRNWWVVGLGVLAVAGIAAAAGGGGDGDKPAATSGATCNAQVVDNCVPGT